MEEKTYLKKYTKYKKKYIDLITGGVINKKDLKVYTNDIYTPNDNIYDIHIIIINEEINNISLKSSSKNSPLFYINGQKHINFITNDEIYKSFIYYDNRKRNLCLKYNDTLFCNTDWKNLPNLLTMITGDVDKIGNYFNSIRIEFINSLLNYLDRELCVDSVSCDHNYLPIANWTSDIDITVFGINAIKIIRLYYKIFPKIWGNTSQYIFDNNLYSEFFFENVKNYNCNLTYKNCESVYKRTKDNKHIYIPFENDTILKNNQHMWAISLFLYRYVQLPFTNLINTINYDEFIKQFKFSQKIDTKYIYLKYILAYEHDFSKLNVLYVDCLNTMLYIKKNYILENNISADYFVDKCTMLQLHTSEAYICYGTVLHIVTNNIHKADINIDNDMYLDSFMENISFAIKECNEFNIHDIHPYKTIVESSKYVESLNALFLYDKNIKRITNDILFDEMLSIFQTIKKIRVKNIDDEIAYKKLLSINTNLFKILNIEDPLKINKNYLLINYIDFLYKITMFVIKILINNYNL